MYWTFGDSGLVFYQSYSQKQSAYVGEVDRVLSELIGVYVVLILKKEENE